MSDKRINIDAAFKKMSDIAGFEGIVFISGQGMVLAAKFAEGTVPAKAADGVAACVKDLEDLIKKVTATRLEELSVKGQARTVIFLRNRALGFLTVVFGRESMHPGLAWLKARETMEALEKSLDQLLSKQPGE